MQLFEAAISNLNLPYTILLGLVLLYWLTVFLGVFDIEMFDFDVDVDADFDIDADVDMDVDADADIDAHGSGFSLGKLLHFFNIGDVPFMIILSFMALFMWAGSIALNHYLGNTSLLLALVFFIPLFIVSLFITKFCSAPFVKIFAAFDTQADRSVIGASCTIKVSVSGNSLGQAEVDTDDFHQLINVKSSDGQRLAKGTQALVIDYNEEGNFYVVEHTS